jgi:hypothetical protein
MATMSIHVQFEEPEHGWIKLSIGSGESSFEGFMSCVPYPSSWETLTALSLMLQGADQATATWFAEPVTYDLRFKREQDRVLLELIEFPDNQKRTSQERKLLSATGSFDEICRPFWKAIRDLQGRFSDEELSRGWQQEFPREAIERLTRLMREKKAQGEIVP